MNNNSQILDALQLFNEKAEKLETLSFTKKIDQEKQTLNISIKPIDDDVTEFLVNRSGSNAEAVDAFVLTFRFFIQDNEKSSFRNLATIYQNPLIPTQLRNEFAEVRKSINEHLDSLPEFGIEIGTHQFRRREILEIFI